MPSNKKVYEEEGLVRMYIDMDFKTYALLLALVEKSGYPLEKPSKNKQEKVPSGQKSKGISGVLAQGIIELYQKYVEEGEEEHNGLDMINQQAYIFANRARAMRINEIPEKEIISKLRGKLPLDLKVHEKGKLLAKKTMKGFVAASTFSGTEIPKLSSGIKKDFIKLEIDHYFNELTKSS